MPHVASALAAMLVSAAVMEASAQGLATGPPPPAARFELGGHIS